MNFMLTRLLVSRLLVNIAYIKIWVHLTFVPVHLRKKLGAPVQKVSLEPCPVKDSLWGSGQASLLTVTPWLLNQLLVPLAVWAGVKSCWKMKSAFP